jgi:hypothetical protein
MNCGSDRSYSQHQSPLDLKVGGGTAERIFQMSRFGAQQANVRFRVLDWISIPARAVFRRYFQRAMLLSRASVNIFRINEVNGLSSLQRRIQALRT